MHEKDIAKGYNTYLRILRKNANKYEHTILALIIPYHWNDPQMFQKQGTSQRFPID